MLNYNYVPIQYNSIGWVDLINNNFATLYNNFKQYNYTNNLHSMFYLWNFGYYPHITAETTLTAINTGNGNLDSGTYHYYICYKGFESDFGDKTNNANVRLYNISQLEDLGTITLSETADIDIHIELDGFVPYPVKSLLLYRTKANGTTPYLIGEIVVSDYTKIEFDYTDTLNDNDIDENKIYMGENPALVYANITDGTCRIYLSKIIGQNTFRWYANLQIKEQIPKLTFIDIIDTDIKIDNGITIQRSLTTDGVSVTGEYFKIINNNEDITGNSNNSLIEIDTYRRAIGIGTTGQSIGNYACGIGRTYGATGPDSFAVGRQSLAGGSDSIAIGCNTMTYSNNCCAIGYDIRCNNLASYGFGRHIRTEKDYSFGLGIVVITKLAKGCFAYSSHGCLDGTTWASSQVEKVILKKKDLVDDGNYSYLEGIDSETTFFVQDGFMYAIEIKALFTHTSSFGAGNSTFVIKRGLVGRSNVLGQAQKYMSNEEYYGTSMPAYLDVEIDIDGNLQIKAKVQGSGNEHYNVVAEVTVIECLKTDI